MKTFTISEMKSCGQTWFTIRVNISIDFIYSKIQA